MSSGYFWGAAQMSGQSGSMWRSGFSAKSMKVSGNLQCILYGMQKKWEKLLAKRHRSQHATGQISKGHKGSGRPAIEGKICGGIYPSGSAPRF